MFHGHFLISTFLNTEVIYTYSLMMMVMMMKKICLI